MKCNKNRKIFIRREMFEEKRANILGKDMVKKRRVIKYRYGGILLRNSIRFRLLLQKNFSLFYWILSSSTLTLNLFLSIWNSIQLFFDFIEQKTSSMDADTALKRTTFEEIRVEFNRNAFNGRALEDYERYFWSSLSFISFLCLSTHAIHPKYLKNTKNK